MIPKRINRVFLKMITDAKIVDNVINWLFECVGGQDSNPMIVYMGRHDKNNIMLITGDAICHGNRKHIVPPYMKEKGREDVLAEYLEYDKKLSFSVLNIENGEIDNGPHKYIDSSFYPILYQKYHQKHSGLKDLYVSYSYPFEYNICSGSLSSETSSLKDDSIQTIYETKLDNRIKQYLVGLDLSNFPKVKDWYLFGQIHLVVIFSIHCHDSEMSTAIKSLRTYLIKHIKANGGPEKLDIKDQK